MGRFCCVLGNWGADGRDEKVTGDTILAAEIFDGGATDATTGRGTPGTIDVVICTIWFGPRDAGVPNGALSHPVELPAGVMGRSGSGPERRFGTD